MQAGGAGEQGQAGLWRSQRKMQVCGARLFWSQDQKRWGTTRRDEEVCGSKAWGGGRRPTKGSNKGERESCRQGLPLPQKALSLLRLHEASPGW